jgi:taurine transport system substrate-binding protein
LVLIALLTALAGSASARSTAATPSTIRIGYQLIPNGDAIVRSQRWLEQAFPKTKIKWIEFDSGASVNQAIVAGAIDVGLAGSSPVTAGLAPPLNIGYRVPWIFDVIGTNEALVVKPGINSIKDLAGKKIATPFASTSHYSLLAALASAHVQASSVDIIDLQPADILAAWQRGDIDGAYVWTPTLAELRKTGKTLITSATLSKQGKTTADLAVVRTAFAKQYPAAVQTWVTQEDRAVKLYGGSTCADADYLAWALELQREGHEIALHNVASSTSRREETLAGFDRFRELFGHDPCTLANHVGNLEAIYHGEERVTGVRRALYNVLTHGRRRRLFEGHVPGSPLFWGDLCAERVSYVRNFVYRDVDTLAACPQMPYRDSAKPYVAAWFAASEGANPESFVRTIGEAAQDRLEASGGLCIMYSHLGAGFWHDQALHPEFERLMMKLAARDGWFAPVAEVLDHLRHVKGVTDLSARQRRELEWRWLRDKVRARTTS